MTGILNCTNCERMFRFRSPQEAEKVLSDLRKGACASHALLREIRCYSKDKGSYPFKGGRT